MENLLSGLSISLIGIIVVMAVLALLALIIYGFGKIIYREGDSKEAGSGIRAIPDAPAAAVQPNSFETPEEEGFSLEVIAAISAALASEMGSAPENIKIHSIEREKLEREKLAARGLSPWNISARREQQSRMY